MAKHDLIARQQAELVARNSYGRLLALLAARSGDIASSEDALSDALVQALVTWPEAGVPANPDGWVFAVARNRLRDRYRSAPVRTSVPLDDNDVAHDGALENVPDVDAIPDKRLALLFTCAHPAIDPAIRTPLMLQTVLGLDAERIAAAYALPAPAMSQRLVRAKKRIRNARIPFRVPDRSEMPARLPAVLEAIYGAYAIDWQQISGPSLLETLSGEALYLAELLAELLPEEPESLGLAALILLSLSRSAARTGPDGAPVALENQDTRLWDTAKIDRGERYLLRAHALGRIGRFQIEAAIQSVHCDSARTGTTDWHALRVLSDSLLRVAPTLGAEVSLAAVIAEMDGPPAGLSALDGIRTAGVERFQPAWATRAHLLAQTGRSAEAAVAYDKALSLTTDAPTRAWLAERAVEARRLSGSATG